MNAPLIAKAISDGARKVASLSGKVASGGVASAAGALAKLNSPTNQPVVCPTAASAAGAMDPGGSFSTTPPPTTTGRPGGKFAQSGPDPDCAAAKTKATAPIQANLPCADCDPFGGGSGMAIIPPAIQTSLLPA